MKIRHVRNRGDRIELKMTAMIDIVFLLLIFFVMTFTIVAPEGDFKVHMPIAMGRPATDRVEPPFPPIRIRLLATDSGNLSGIRMGERDLGRNFKALGMEIRQIVGDRTGTSRAGDVEIEIDADYALHYEYVVDAITAVSGYVGPDNSVIKVCEKIKFSPIRAPSP